MKLYTYLIDVLNKKSKLNFNIIYTKNHQFFSKNAEQSSKNAEQYKYDEIENQKHLFIRFINP